MSEVVKTHIKRYRVSFCNGGGELDFIEVSGTVNVKQAINNIVRNTPYFNDGDRIAVREIN